MPLYISPVCLQVGTRPVRRTVMGMALDDARIARLGQFFWKFYSREKPVHGLCVISRCASRVDRGGTPGLYGHAVERPVGEPSRDVSVQSQDVLTVE